MTPGQIQGALKDKGIFQKDIASELNVSEYAVSAVINKVRVSDRIMRAIAAKIGKEPWGVFDYYTTKPKRSTSKTIMPFNRNDRASRRKQQAA